MNYNNGAVQHHPAVDNYICKPALAELKHFIKQPDYYTQCQGQYALYEESHNRIIHYPRHNGIRLVETSRINQNLGTEPVAHIKKIQKEKLGSEPVLAHLFAVIIRKN
jgi:hypothetical protein